MPRFLGIVRRARLDEAIAQRDHYRAMFEGANLERDEAVARLSGAREAIARHHSSHDALAVERDEALAKLAAAEAENAELQGQLDHANWLRVHHESRADILLGKLQRLRADVMVALGIRPDDCGE